MIEKDKEKKPAHNRSDRQIRRNDLLLIGSLALLSVILLIIPIVTSVKPKSPALLIQVDGKEYGTYPLTTDREIEINDSNVCRIQNGKVKMISADCPDQICIQESAIDENGGTIVCLPNKVVLSIVDARNQKEGNSMGSHGDKIARKVAVSGLLLALAVLFGYVEAIIPGPMPVPGMKLGLANIVIVTILYLAGWKEAIVISALRVLIIGFLFGNLFSISYGLAGTAFSILGMALVRKTGRFSVVSVSALGGVLHNCGQILVATLVVIGFPWKWYLPVLMLAGLGAGIVTGFLNRLIIPRVKRLWG